ncbi:hypothetical protein C8R43DRAFT_1132826 [Mycena crocata]|nr:hypothetical protein C8R43DRAFT_1132826 [Mycena crocata]
MRIRASPAPCPAAACSKRLARTVDVHQSQPPSSSSLSAAVGDCFLRRSLRLNLNCLAAATSALGSILYRRTLIRTTREARRSRGVMYMPNALRIPWHNGRPLAEQATPVSLPEGLVVQLAHTASVWFADCLPLTPHAMPPLLLPPFPPRTESPPPLYSLLALTSPFKYLRYLHIPKYSKIDGSAHLYAPNSFRTSTPSSRSAVWITPSPVDAHSS